MRRKCPVVLAFVLVFAIGNAAAQPPSPLQDYVPGELLVKFKSTSTAHAKLRLKATAKARATARFKKFRIERWKLPPEQDMGEAMAALRDSGEVEYVEPNYRRYPRVVIATPTDYFDQWNNWPQLGLDQARSWLEANKLNLAEAVIAVVDDSVDRSHAKLANYIWRNTDEVAGDGLDNDNGGVGNGFVDDIQGWDFVGADNDPTPSATELCPIDDVGAISHGTQVAGAVGAMAARVNDSPGTTVNWPVRIMPLRIGCFYTVANEIEALQYALANGADIVNASYGGPQFSLGERDAMLQLADKNILVVAAAGNFDGNNDRVPDYPSSLNMPNIIAVGATNMSNRLTDWSHYGQTSVDLAAPGEGVVTTSAGGGFEYVDGTSFSAPIVAGVAALVKSAFPAAEFRDLKGAILASVNPAISTGLMATDGSVNAAQALLAANTSLALANAEPVLVIHDIVVDDRTSGNGNGLLDPNESATLRITLENVWKNVMSVTAGLSSDATLPLTIETATAPYGAIEAGSQSSAGFEVRLGAVSGHHVIPFTLTVTADASSVERHFRLEVGTLAADTPVHAVIHRHTDAQDEFHYYHMEVPPGQDTLLIQLVADAPSNLHLLARHGSPPLFDYAFGAYTNPAIGVNDGTLVSAAPGGRQVVEIRRPAAGTWHAVVVTPFEARETDIGYAIGSSFPQRRSGGGGAFDPIGVLILIASIGYFWGWRRD